MANQPPEITSLNANIGTITETVTVGGTLQWFSNSLVQRNFLPRHSAQGILGMGAVTADLKAGNLMDSVFAKIRGSRTAEERRRWFEEFVAIFSQDGAYAQLVEDLKSSAGIGAGGGDVGGAANEGKPLCFQPFMTFFKFFIFQVLHAMVVTSLESHQKVSCVLQHTHTYTHKHTTLTPAHTHIPHTHHTHTHTHTHTHMCYMHTHTHYLSLSASTSKYFYQQTLQDFQSQIWLT